MTYIRRVYAEFAKFEALTDGFIVLDCGAMLLVG